MKKLLIICLVLVLSSVAYGTKVSGVAEDRMGAFTGSGTEQDDNMKASMDLAHTDLDAIIRDLGIVRGTNSSIFYVDSGTAGSTGISWATAVADVEAATVLCTAAAGDIIVCAPGHAEAMTAADDIDLDKTGIKVVCLGEGNARATFSYTANGEFVIGADNCAVYNARFIATSDSVVKAIDVENGVDGWTIANCEFSAETTTVDEFDDVIIIGTTCTAGTIRDCKFLGDVGSNADPQSCINFNTANYLKIVGNEFYGDRAVACIENAAASNFPLIKDNVIFNGIIGGTAGLNAVAAITLHASTSALIIDNDIICNMTEESAIVAADGFCIGNRYNESEGVGTSLIKGQTYVSVSAAASVAAAAVDLFVVAGGPIEIISMFAVCGTAMASNPGACSVWCDATTGDQDADLTTAVNIDSVGAGDVITFHTVTGGEMTLDPTVNVNAGIQFSAYAPIGTIEQKTASTGTGTLVWYITYRPLVDGVTVTP